MSNSIFKQYPFFLAILIIMGYSATSAARSVEDYFHSGSAKYIQGRIQEASVDIEEGLRKYPQDPRLKSLAAQLKAMKDQKKQDQGGGGSQGEQDPNKKDEKKDNKKDSSSQGDQQNKKPDQNQDQKDKGKDSDQEQSKAQQGKEDPAKKDQGDSTGHAQAPAKPGEMSKEEAERLLNSYQDDEKKEHEQMQRRQKGSVEVEKDW